ncbi:MAG: TolC family protein [Gammaproteobacteria bacterium]
MSQFTAGAAVAQEEVSLSRGSLVVSEALAFETVLEAALGNAPAARSEANLRATAEAYDALGNSWVSSRPSLQLSYYDDSPLDDVGLREIESGVSFNLWRPGERDDTATLGDRHQERLEAWQGHLRLMVAGQVRAVLAELAAAESLLDIARQADSEAQRLVTITTDMAEAGASAQSDVLQARTLRLQRQQAVIQARTRLASAEQAYAVLTGLAMRPAARLVEVIEPAVAIPQSHPTLHFLQTQLAIASAKVNLARHQASGRPALSLGVRRERGDRLQPYIDSLAVSVSVPIGKSPATAASVGLARSDEVDAEVTLIETRRQLEQRRAQIDQELALLGESVQLGVEQVAITAQRYEMSIAAFEVGEIDLTQVVIAQQQATQARMDLETLRLRRQRISSEYNQIIGVLP